MREYSLLKGKPKSCGKCYLGPDLTGQVFGMLTVLLLDKLFEKQDRRCALSGLVLEFGRIRYKEQTASLDRIDSSKGYVRGNIQWIHKDINWMKTKFPQDYFIELCKLVSSNCSLGVDHED